MASRNWTVLTAALAFAAASFATKTAKATDCTTDAQCAGTRTPICLTQFGICGCQNDKQCGGEGSGLICTASPPVIGRPPYCTAGCGPADGDGGRNECSTGETCSAPSGGTGSCEQDCLTAPGLCTSKPILNKCSLLGGSGLTQCVECTGTADCASKVGAEICNPTTNRCVQCNDDTDCTGKPNGQRCRLPDRSCGCENDSHCLPGRICNNTIKACLPGPRDAGTGDGSTGDGSTGDGSTGDGSTGDGSTGDGSIGDGSTGDGSTGDGGPRDSGVGDGRADSGRLDGGAGDSGTGDDDGNYGSSLEGGGCDCSVAPMEDTLPIGGLIAVGGFFAFFTRRRAKKNTADRQL